MKHLTILTILACSCAGMLAATTLWQDGHLFSAQGRILPGDILKIHFAYRNMIRYRNEMKTGETQKVSFGKPDAKTFSFLPALDNNTMFNRNNNLEYNNEREFATTIAVMVQGVATNGIVTFRGLHRVFLNGQDERVELSGQVRAADVGEGNRIMSTDIANLSFAWYGPEAQRQNRLTAADLATTTNTNALRADSPELNAAMRQRLLLQYLNRMHDLLFR